MTPVATLVLVRHGRPAAGWDADVDPGLDDVGRAQAEAMADALAASLAGPWPMLVSPLRRTRETAASLAARWDVAPVVTPEVGEIASPSPEQHTMDERMAWLRDVLGRRWGDLGPALRAWRASVLDRLVAIERDTVVVSHFVAINVAVGAATGDDRVTCFRPGHCSRTVLEVVGRGLRLVELGEEAATQVT